METKPQAIKPGAGARLASARHAARLTLKELGAKCGYCDSSLSAVERGHDMPSLRMLVAVADALNVNPCWLATGLGEMDADAATRVERRAEALLNELETQSASGTEEQKAALADPISRLRAALEPVREYQAHVARIKQSAAIKPARKKAPVIA